MSKRINSYQDLVEEKTRLEALLSAQKELVRQDVNEIREELAPLKTAVTWIGKVTTKDKGNWLMTATADTIIDIVLKKMVLSKAGWITKLVVPFFMKNFSSHVIADNKNKIVSALSSFLSKKNGKMKHSKKKKQAGFEEEEED
jgi:hypothetical protein